MTWVKLEDGFTEHHKVMDLSHEAFRLHVSALCYCGRQLSDGLVPVSAVRRMGVDDAPTFAAELVAAGLWDETEGGWEIHDYLAHQRSKDEVVRDREAARLRQRKRRESRRDSAGTSDVVTGGVRLPDTDTDTDTDTDLLVSSTSDSTPEPGDDDEPERRSDGEKIRDAFELIVERRIGDKTPDDPRAYAATVRAAVRTEHAKAANEALSVHPDWNAHDLCEYLEPLKVKPAVAPEDVEERRRAEWRAGEAERTAARLAADAERAGVLEAEAGIEQVRAIKQGLRKSKAA